VSFIDNYFKISYCYFVHQVMMYELIVNQESVVVKMIDSKIFMSKSCPTIRITKSFLIVCVCVCVCACVCVCVCVCV